jgi:hypothetical protein
VNDLRESFSHTLIRSLDPSFPPGAALEWVSPLRNQRYDEYRDEEFLEKLGLYERSNKLKQFWPKKGPCWDGLGVIKATNPRGVVLVEAKSHIAEMASVWGPKSEESRELITRALDRTAESLAVRRNSAWTEKYYQTANRYAHLFFLREIVRVPAWLVFVYFTDDRSVEATSLADWQKALEEVKEGMGLSATTVPFTSTLFLEAVNTK